MNLTLVQEVVKLILAVLGSLGMVATPIVVAVINNRNKKEKAKEAIEGPPMGQPVDVDQQKFTRIMMEQLEDILEAKNELEKRLRDMEYENRKLLEKLADQEKPSN